MKKGSTLIIAVMIAAILLILTSGLYVLISSLRTDTEKTALFYSAESGINHALKQLRVINSDVKDFETGQNVDKINDKEFEINGNLVNITATFDDNTFAWTLTSVASKSGRSCTVVLSNITTTSMANFTMGMIGAMSDGLEYGTGDEFEGDVLFGSVLNITDVPTFWGKVKSYSKDFSMRSTNESSYTTAYSNRNVDLTSYLQSMQGGKYQYGLRDKTVYESDDAAGKLALDNRIKNVFQNGYENDQTAEIDWDEGVTYSWDEIKDFNDGFGPASSGMSIKKVSAASTVEFKNNGIYLNNSLLDSKYNCIAVSGSNTVTLLGGELPKDFTIFTEKGDVVVKNDIYYPGLSSYISKSFDDANAQIAKSIKGVIKNTTTPMPKFAIIAGAGATQDGQGNVWIAKDGTYGTLAPTSSISDQSTQVRAFDVTQKIEQQEYKNTGTYNHPNWQWVSKADGSLIEGQTRTIQVDPYSYTRESSTQVYDNSLLITGSIYTKNGKFGTYADANNSNNFEGVVKVMTVGSVVMKTKGLYRNVHSNGSSDIWSEFSPTGSPTTSDWVYNYNNTKRWKVKSQTKQSKLNSIVDGTLMYGINVVMSDDERFSKMRPLGYKAIVEIIGDEPYIGVSERDMRWSFHY